MRRPLLLGHRGVRGRRYGVRENTIAAFDLALQHGCDGFECDVRLTADQCAVICHDQKFSGVTIARAKAENLSPLALLEDVLARFANRAFLDIELKLPGLESCLLSALGRHPPHSGYVVSSFLPQALSTLHERDRSIPLGLICETRKQLACWRNLPIQYVIAKRSLITPELVIDVHRVDKKLIAWTVNSRESMVRLAECGVDGIISDKTDLLVKTLGKGNCV